MVFDITISYVSVAGHQQISSDNEMSFTHMMSDDDTGLDRFLNTRITQTNKKIAFCNIAISLPVNCMLTVILLIFQIIQSNNTVQGDPNV